MIAISVSTNKDRIEIVTASNGVVIAHFDEVSEIRDDGRFMIVRLTDGKASVMLMSPVFRNLLTAQIKEAEKAHSEYMMARKSYKGQFETGANWRDEMKKMGVVLC